MPRNFIDGLGYTVTGDALSSTDCKAACERVVKVWGGGGGGGGQSCMGFRCFFNVQNVEKQRADTCLPQRYQSRPGKTYQLVGSVFKKFVANLRESMPNPFEFVYPMPPGSVIVFGVESGDKLAHTDTSTAPHVLAPSDQAKSDSHLSTFVALSP